MRLNSAHVRVLNANGGRDERTDFFAPIAVRLVAFVIRRANIQHIRAARIARSLGPRHRRRRAAAACHALVDHTSTQVVVFDNCDVEVSVGAANDERARRQNDEEGELCSQ